VNKLLWLLVALVFTFGLLVILIKVTAGAPFTFLPTLSPVYKAVVFMTIAGIAWLKYLEES